ncbi:hypothetical protein D3C78_794280 [compost metagenome]
MSAAASRKQTDGDLRQSQKRFRLVNQQAVMAGQCQLQPTTQRQTVQGRDEGFSTRLDTTEQAVLAFEAQGCVACSHALGIGLDQLLEIGTGDETGLGRGDYGALDVLAPQNLLDSMFKVRDQLRGEHVDRLIRKVEGKDGDAIGFDVQFHCRHGEFSEIR